jgi:hypothetical protein
MTTQTRKPRNGIEMPADVNEPEIQEVNEPETPAVGDTPDGVPNVSNPAEPTHVDVPDNTDENPIGNVNGAEQADEVELHIPTAVESADAEIARIQNQLAMAQARKRVASANDLAIELLNSVFESDEADSESLTKFRAAFTALKTNNTLDILWNGKTFQYGVNVPAGRSTSPTSRNLGNAGDGAKRESTFFATLISPDGQRHAAPMRGERSNDNHAMEQLTGLSFKDGGGNSMSKNAQKKHLEANNWKFEMGSI